MKFKLFFVMILLCALSACTAKTNAPDMAASQPIEAKPSILDVPELDFMDAYGEGLVFSKPEQALKDIDKNITEAGDADITALLVVRSLVLSQLGRKDEAFDDMTKAVQSRPDAELYALRGFVLWRGGKVRGAMRDAEYALYKQKDIPLGTMMQGLALYSEEQMDKACPLLETACKQGQCFGIEFAQEQGQCK